LGGVKEDGKNRNCWRGEKKGVRRLRPIEKSKGVIGGGPKVLRGKSTLAGKREQHKEEREEKKSRPEPVKKQNSITEETEKQCRRLRGPARGKKKGDPNKQRKTSRSAPDFGTAFASGERGARRSRCLTGKRKSWRQGGRNADARTQRKNRKAMSSD